MIASAGVELGTTSESAVGTDFDGLDKSHKLW